MESHGDVGAAPMSPYAAIRKALRSPFDNILDRVTGSDPSVTDYVLEQPAKCPNCKREILEKTLIEPKAVEFGFV